MANHLDIRVQAQLIPNLNHVRKVLPTAILLLYLLLVMVLLQKFCNVVKEVKLKDLKFNNLQRHPQRKSLISGVSGQNLLNNLRPKLLRRHPPLRI